MNSYGTFFWVKKHRNCEFTEALSVSHYLLKRGNVIDVIAVWSETGSHWKHK